MRWELDCELIPITREEYFAARDAADRRRAMQDLHPDKEKFGLSSCKIIKPSDLAAPEAKGCLLLGKNKDRSKESSWKIVIKILPLHPDLPPDLDDSETYFQKTFFNDLVKEDISPNFVEWIQTLPRIKYDAPCLKAMKLKQLQEIFHIQDSFNILALEYIEGRDLDYYLHSRRMKGKKKMSLMTWKCMLFQLMYTMAVLQDKYQFLHRDFHPGNILISEYPRPKQGNNKKKKKKQLIRFIFRGIDFYIPDKGITPKIWDFEFSQTKHRRCDAELTKDTYQNDDFTKDRYIDIHFFLRELLSIPDLPKEIRRWIKSLYKRPLLEIPGTGTSTGTNISIQPHHHTSGFGSAIRRHGRPKGLRPKKETWIDHDSYEETEYLKNGQLKVEPALAAGFRLWTPEELILTHPFFAEFKFKTDEIVKTDDTDTDDDTDDTDASEEKEITRTYMYSTECGPADPAIPVGSIPVVAPPVLPAEDDPRVVVVE